MESNEAAGPKPIDRTDMLEIAALRVAVKALIVTHPNRNLFRKAFEKLIRQAQAEWASLGVPPADLQFARVLFEGLLDTASGETDGRESPV